MSTCSPATSRAILSISRSPRRAFNITVKDKRFLTVSPPRTDFSSHSTGIGDPVQVFGGRITPNYFDVLGVRPILGRNFRPDEEEGADVAVITKSFWQKRLGGDPNVIGRSITLDGMPHTIVGVLPNAPTQWFGANPIAEVWTTKPFQLPGFSYERMMRGTGFLRVIGRMKPGITIEQVRAALPSLEQGYRATLREQDRQHGHHVGQNASTGCDRKHSRRLRDAFCCGLLCVADRMQQRRESFAGPLQRPASRDRTPNGGRRIAQQYRAGSSFGKVCW